METACIAPSFLVSCETRGIPYLTQRASILSNTGPLQNTPVHKQPVGDCIISWRPSKAAVSESKRLYVCLLSLCEEHDVASANTPYIYDCSGKKHPVNDLMFMFGTRLYDVVEEDRL